MDEILTMMNVALGNAPCSACLAGDANGDGQITAGEIIITAVDKRAQRVQLMRRRGGITITHD